MTSEPPIRLMRHQRTRRRRTVEDFMSTYCKGRRHCEVPAGYNVFSREDGAAAVVWPPPAPAPHIDASSTTQSPTETLLVIPMEPALATSPEVLLCAKDDEGNFGSATLKRDNSDSQQLGGEATGSIEQQLVAFDYQVQTTTTTAVENLERLEQHLGAIVAQQLLARAGVDCPAENAYVKVGTKTALRNVHIDDLNDRRLFASEAASRFLQTSPVTGLKSGPPDYVFSADDTMSCQVSDDNTCLYTIRGAFTLLGSTISSLEQKQDEMYFRENEDSNDQSLSSAVEPAQEATDDAMTEGLLDQVDESILKVTYVGPVDPEDFNPPTTTKGDNVVGNDGNKVQGKGDPTDPADDRVWQWYLLWAGVIGALLGLACVARRRRRRQQEERRSRRRTSSPQKMERVENNYTYDEDPQPPSSRRAAAAAASSRSAAAAAAAPQPSGESDSYIPGGGGYDYSSPYHHPQPPPSPSPMPPTLGVAAMATEFAMQAQRTQSSEGYDDDSDIFVDVERVVAAPTTESLAAASFTDATIPVSNAARARTVPTSNARSSLATTSPPLAAAVHDQNVFRVIHTSSDEVSSSDDEPVLFRDRGSSDDYDYMGGFPNLL